MTTTFRATELLAAITLSGRDQLLQMPFKAGVAHVDGKYGFTQDNFLLEGANRILGLGADAIFVYMEPKYNQRYPQNANGPFWPATTPTSLTQLAQSAPFQALFNMPFKLFVLTANGFSTHDDMDSFQTNPNWADFEEQEFYDVTRYLYSTYAGTGKTFILKNWEGDYRALGFGHNTEDIPVDKIDAMNIWMSARQRGVAHARTDSGEPGGVGVFHAVELARVLDYTDSGLRRLINATLPVVNADMVSYSSYDSSASGADAATTRAQMNEAFNAIKSLAPDPLGFGNKRIFISEYGLFENRNANVDKVGWRTNTILETSQAAGLLGAFFWQIFDNECYLDFPTSKNQPYPVDAQGDQRPPNNKCEGLWLVRPDGTPGPAQDYIDPWFQPSAAGVTLTGRITNASTGAGIANAAVEFFGGRAMADANGNYSLTNVPPDVAPATTQFTASAPNFQNASQSVTVSGSGNPTINFALTPSTALGSVSGKVISAVDGAVLSGVTISYSGGSAITDASGAFSFASIPGGAYTFTAQRSGWIAATIKFNVLPGINSPLFLRMATGGKLGGHVNNSAGAGVTGANVNAHGGLAPTNVNVTTGAGGAYDFGWIAVGNYHLVATSAADGETADDPQATLTVGASTTKDLVLTPKADFSLTVTPTTRTITGGQLATFTIQLNPIGGFNTPVMLSASGLPAGGTASFNPAVISSGSATLSVTTSVTTPTGNYVITIMGEAPGLQHTTQATLAVSAAPGTAAGKVTNAATGAPISGAKVTYGTNSATTDASGNYSLGNLPAGTLQLTASATGYLNTVQTVTITPGGTTTANFVLITVTGTITGRVTNASTGAGLAGATVSYSGGSTKADTNGYYTLSAVNPGTYTVTATLTGWVTESTSVTVVSGGTVTGNIKLATGGKAAGKVTNKSGGAISGATVKVTGGIVPTTVTITTNSTGNYDSGWVPIGNYSITVSKSGFTTQTKNTTVTTGGTVTVNFTLQ
ncbi:MAG TPA: carboxypeptidase regulatory-like domain-containing protein [Candidatus Angelobacter sp.]